MTLEQEEHLIALKRRFMLLSDKKYRAGQAEHGGNLWELTAIQLLDAAIDEAIDQVIYLLTLKDRINAITSNSNSASKL